ncbi:MAG: hypothetical protein ACRDIL_15320, partial [Candidatus Limnocylindrales bacterium]
TLIKLRDKIEGRRSRPARVADAIGLEPTEPAESELTLEDAVVEPPESEPERARPVRELSDDALVNAKASLSDALEELVGVLRSPDAVEAIADVDRANLAKYLTIAKLRLENAIAIVRSGEPRD